MALCGLVDVIIVVRVFLACGRTFILQQGKLPFDVCTIQSYGDLTRLSMSRDIEEGYRCLARLGDPRVGAVSCRWIETPSPSPSMPRQ